MTLLLLFMMTVAPASAPAAAPAPAVDAQVNQEAQQLPGADAPALPAPDPSPWADVLPEARDPGVDPAPAGTEMEPTDVEDGADEGPEGRRARGTGPPSGEDDEGALDAEDEEDADLDRKWTSPPDARQLKALDTRLRRWTASDLQALWGGALIGQGLGVVGGAVLGAVLTAVVGVVSSFGFYLALYAALFAVYGGFILGPAGSLWGAALVAGILGGVILLPLTAAGVLGATVGTWLSGTFAAKRRLPLGQVAATIFSVALAGYVGGALLHLVAMVAAAPFAAWGISVWIGGVVLAPTGPTQEALGQVLGVTMVLGVLALVGLAAPLLTNGVAMAVGPGLGAFLAARFGRTRAPHESTMQLDGGTVGKPRARDFVTRSKPDKRKKKRAPVVEDDAELKEEFGEDGDPERPFAPDVEEVR